MYVCVLSYLNTLRKAHNGKLLHIHHFLTSFGLKLENVGGCREEAANGVGHVVIQVRETKMKIKSTHNQREKSDDLLDGEQDGSVERSDVDPGIAALG